MFGDLQELAKSACGGTEKKETWARLKADMVRVLKDEEPCFFSAKTVKIAIKRYIKMQRSET